ncbi:uncharacterized protein BP5553_07687 [Venustampulla echinocandica]|uniref:Diphthamide biosynthesis protein 4 n=1 Tax=Venustampulla echinocandica TaxID=2656787 RepID=A0A370TH86_9HELO|nr:uncharacterized protein BP5553_07687 [Venustampulla echinocandica]RDL34559.1 hypothetical protein BP5553_07687 [Venustampulla echinocandica]
MASNDSQNARSEPSAATVPEVGHDVVDRTPTAGNSTVSGTSNTSADESAFQHLNVDYEDHDSAIGGMTPMTSTMSLNSSIYEFVEENGRTYHRYKEGKYMLPNDAEEMDRLDLQHQLWLITLYGKLYLAPICNPHNVLDIGTGTGIWAIEFANSHPSARVTGSDLSPIQPEYVPSNCQFEVDDAEDDWNYSQPFDLIHGRALVTCFKEPATVIASAFKALTPGGYLEFQDIVLPMRAIDDTLQGTAINDWQTRTINAAESMGKNWKLVGNYVQYFEEAGFVDVVETHFQWPLNTWPKGERMKTLGRYWQEDLLRGLEGLSMAVLTRAGGMTMDEVLKLTTEARKDLHNKSIHGYLPMHKYLKVLFPKIQARRPHLICCQASACSPTSAPDGSMTYMPNYYEILGLPKDFQHESDIPTQTLRSAYRRALLQNHPDKTPLAKPSVNTKGSVYTIDQIAEAFNVLSIPRARAEYNKELKLQNGSTNIGGVQGRQAFHTGVETLDLDDLEADEAQGIWYRSCRCGDGRGFLVTEDDLEEAADDGELHVGCRGCSLWLKVLFGVIEDDGQAGAGPETTGDMRNG